jgi:tetratricopeptide (TPR) repeat protein
MRMHRRLLNVVLLISGLAGPVAAEDIKAATWGVEFPTSQSGAAQDHFLSGVTALHLFMYEDAVEHFRAAQRAAPSFALAYWGEALAQYRPIWRIYNRAEARAVLNRLGPTAQERAAKAPTAREKAYLATLDVLYADGPPAERQRAYAEQMRQLSSAHPDDLEALAFYCVSRVMIYSRVTNAADRMDTAAMALEILAHNPLHPGAPRYLIQATDDPEHASLGLAGVRALKGWKAPGGAESIHIPSHVYVQLGMWDEAERVNASAFDVSMAWMKAHGSGLADLNMHDYEHLLRWRQYSLLQLGRLAEARTLTARAGTDYPGSGKSTAVGTAFYRLRAQYMLETGQWSLVTDLTRDARADGYYDNPFVLQAIGIGAAKAGQLDLARQVAEQLRGEKNWRSQAEYHEVMGLLALAENDSASALQHLAEAVAIDEKNVSSHGLGVPEPSKPVWELYGEVLLEQNRPKEALAQFKRSLTIYRRRPASLLGAARASATIGDRKAFEEYRTELMTIWHNADADHAGAKQIRLIQSN